MNLETSTSFVDSKIEERRSRSAVFCDGLLVSSATATPYPISVVANEGAPGRRGRGEKEEEDVGGGFVEEFKERSSVEEVAYLREGVEGCRFGGLEGAMDLSFPAHY
ncbi:unnamed protein product [Linum trigynum]|uniref:Uncharacterized protein n=1 Tax=Linum trigynum TaxID=586398 RepID=A0AAV2GNS2_9ROSI